MEKYLKDKMKLKKFFTDKILLQRIMFLIIGLVAFRLVTSTPIANISTETLHSLLLNNQILNVFNLFSGGGLSNFSVGMLGVIPYITVSIIVQLMTSVFPSIHSLYHEQGEVGRKKIGNYIRLFSVPLAAINAFGILWYFRAQGVLINLSNYEFAVTLVTVVAGAVLVMWIGELLTEFGIGNGISLIVFAGIVVNIPTLLGQLIQTFTVDQVPFVLLLVVGIMIFVFVTVLFNEAFRPIPLTQINNSGIGRSETYLPIKVNVTGVLPLIFAFTIVAFFNYGSVFLTRFNNVFIQTPAEIVQAFLANSFYYAIPIFITTFLFTFFHAPIVYDTEKVSLNLQKQGLFTPGLRPGDETKKYLDTVLSRITFYAAAFLAIVAAVPFLFSSSTVGNFLFAIGGAGVLIIVSVVLDIYHKIHSRLSV